MIRLHFNLRNPFIDQYDQIYNADGKSWHPHKFWNLSIIKTDSIIGFNFDYTIREDHAGLKFEFSLMGWGIDFHFYDHRHWNAETNKYTINDLTVA